MFVKPLLAVALAAPLLGLTKPDVSIASHPTHPWVAACEDWDEWDKPGPAFRIYGNTWYVGTCGISAILITSEEGHVLTDTGTEAGADVVLDNIRSLGFDPADIKLLLNSHEHFDHVGGLIKVQEATNAPIVTSREGMEVIASGKDHRDDPQFGMHEPMRPLPQSSYAIEPYPILSHQDEKAQFLLDRFGMWPIPTPGHTPGAMSWKWRACDDSVCKTVVYADSLSAVSSDGYRFLDHERYLADFFASLQRIADSPCDILLTPHPSGSWMRNKLKGGDLTTSSSLECDAYMRQQRASLFIRLSKEDPEWMAKNLLRDPQ